MADFTAQVDDLKFVCADHDKIMDTVNELVTAESTCNFCGDVPIAIVYRDWDDKITAACKAHEEIVLEMIERNFLPKINGK